MASPWAGRYLAEEALDSSLAWPLPRSVGLPSKTPLSLYLQPPLPGVAASGSHREATPPSRPPPASSRSSQRTLLKAGQGPCCPPSGPPGPATSPWIEPRVPTTPGGYAIMGRLPAVPHLCRGLAASASPWPASLLPTSRALHDCSAPRNPATHVSPRLAPALPTCFFAVALRSPSPGPPLCTSSGNGALLTPHGSTAALALPREPPSLLGGLTVSSTGRWLSSLWVPGTRPRRRPAKAYRPGRR